MKRNIILLMAICALAVAARAQTPITAPSVTNPPPKKTWEGSAAVGLTLTRGNSRTILFSGSLQATKKWDKNELDLGADGVYGKSQDPNTGNDVKNAESLHGFSQYNRLFTERMFGYLRVEGLHDAIADIRYRITVGPGGGYYFIKNTNTALRGEIGPSYVYERDTDETTHDYWSLRLAERLDQRLSSTAKLWESLEVLPQVDKFDNYIANAEVGVESSISTKLSLQVVLQDTYHSRPATDRLKNDMKLIAGVKYKF